MNTEPESHKPLYSFADSYMAATWLLAVFNVNCGTGPARWPDEDHDDDCDELRNELCAVLDDIRDGDPPGIMSRAAFNRGLKLDGSLWQLMWPLAYFFIVDMQCDDTVRGLFPAGGGRPQAASIADFIYMAFFGIDVHFTDMEFKTQYAIMIADLASELEYLADDEDGG